MSVKDFVKQWSNVVGGRFKSGGTTGVTDSAEISVNKTRANSGNERSNMQKFWLTLIRDVLGVDKPENFIQFEVPVQLAHKSFIDGYLPDSKVIVEQKSFGVDLSKEISQSDGTKLTPYEQARRYVTGLPLSMHPKKIVTCNFAEFRIYDMETLEPPTVIKLDELPEKFHALDFLIDPTRNKIRLELELSLQAGEIVAKIYDALLTQYVDPNSAESLSSLNKLCVRLVFCLYAESTGLFGKRKIFRDWLTGSRNIRRDLLDLFDTLNTPVDKRDPYLDDDLKKFPFVNGGLFAGKIEIPNFTPEIRDLLLDEASSGFNWAGISPTIFGSVFESTLNPETRRAGGMHYTSIENIHKVIDPLFLDDLREEFSRIKTRKKLLEFRDKLAAIKIFDPACGSGNFLTESFLSLRRLENEVLKQIFGAQIQLGDIVDPVKVSIANFYGIEINDFAVAVAQTALWIAELQMLAETAEIVHKKLDALPLKTYANIHEDNALKLDWHDACPPDVNFIIGNPPFVGASMMTSAQKTEAVAIFGKLKLSNSIDYVGAWYHLAAKFMTGTNIKAAFVSTSSITQGEQVTPLWKKVL
ncbi:MAG: class I SAM-dependent DNA methyltransferase, partial [Selenomonadaceae bacterium]|nr:class I SAM-dependent DNA methyltransferase [Selenomonadaceae bacterium]